jgi:hypothetical protein
MKGSLIAYLGFLGGPAFVLAVSGLLRRRRRDGTRPAAPGPWCPTCKGTCPLCGSAIVDGPLVEHGAFSHHGQPTYGEQSRRTVIRHEREDAANRA